MAKWSPSIYASGYTLIGPIFLKYPFFNYNIFTLEPSFPRSNLCDAISKAEPLM